MVAGAVKRGPTIDTEAVHHAIDIDPVWTQLASRQERGQCCSSIMYEQTSIGAAQFYAPARPFVKGGENIFACCLERTSDASDRGKES